MSIEYFPEEGEVAWEALREREGSAVSEDVPAYEDEGVIHKSIILFIGLLIVLIPVLALLISHSTGNSKVDIYYRITVPRSCLELDAQYSDIRLGSRVEVFDGSNTSMGIGRLEVHNTVGTGCVYTALFTVNHPADGTYEIATGNSERGRLKFMDSDLVVLQQGRTLVVSAKLG